MLQLDLENAAKEVFGFAQRVVKRASDPDLSIKLGGGRGHDGFRNAADCWSSRLIAAIRALEQGLEEAIVRAQAPDRVAIDGLMSLSDASGLGSDLNALRRVRRRR
jgi:hypothetical protein